MGMEFYGSYRPNNSITFAYILVIRMIKIKVVSKFAYFCHQYGSDSKPLVTGGGKQEVWK